MATVNSEDYLQGDTLVRPPRFGNIAEYSFKSPIDMNMTRQSRSPKNGSMKRRISHSPVSVNTTYELSEKNT